MAMAIVKSMIAPAPSSDPRNRSTNGIEDRPQSIADSATNSTAHSTAVVMMVMMTGVLIEACRYVSLSTRRRRQWWMKRRDGSGRRRRDERHTGCVRRIPPRSRRTPLRLIDHGTPAAETAARAAKTVAHVCASCDCRNVVTARNTRTSATKLLRLIDIDVPRETGRRRHLDEIMRVEHALESHVGRQNLIRGHDRAVLPAQRCAAGRHDDVRQLVGNGRSSGVVHGEFSEVTQVSE